MIQYAPLDSRDAGTFSALAFPRHRVHLDSIGPSHSDPVQAGAAERSTAVGASVFGQPVGLAVATQSAQSSQARLLSVVVDASLRRGGVGTTLLANLERELRMSGLTELWARYREGCESEPVAGLLARQRYECVDERSVVHYSAEPRRLLQSSGLAAGCRGFESTRFAHDLIERVRPLGDCEGLSPTFLTIDQHDPAWSFLASCHESLAGWIVGHAVGGAIHCSALYVLPEQRSWNLAASLIRTFLFNIADKGVGRVTWEVSLDRRTWLRLMDRLLGRYVDERIVIRTMRKRLMLPAVDDGHERLANSRGSATSRER